MKNIQKGFTLIELMTVVALIGILAGVGFPASTDYPIKSKLSELTSVTSPARMAVSVVCNDLGGTWSAMAGGTLASAQPAVPATAKYADPSTANTNTTAAGVVTAATLTTGTGLPAGNITWTPTCTSAGTTWTVGGSIAAKYLPKS